MNRIVILPSLALLLSCAPNFPVYPYGPDTYVVHVESFSAAKARGAAVKTANEYCGERNLVMMPDAEGSEASFDPRAPPWAGPRKDIQFIFRCLDAGDPRLQPPEMRPTQRLIIEDD